MKKRGNKNPGELSSKKTKLELLREEVENPEDLGNPPPEENSIEEILLWRQRTSKQDLLEKFELELQEAHERGKLAGQLNGEIKAEISTIKTLIGLSISEEKIIPTLKFLTQDKVKGELESNIEYIKTHLELSESQIFNDLNLTGLLPTWDSNSENSENN